VTKFKTIDLLAGAFVIVIGLLAIYESTGFTLGSARRIGPGYFPFFVGLMMVILGIAIALENLWSASDIGTTLEWPPLRAPILILASVGCFAAMIERFGLAPAGFVAVFLASLADSTTSLRQKLAVSVAVPAVTLLIFKYGLSMNVDVIRWRP